MFSRWMHLAITLACVLASVTLLCQGLHRYASGEVETALLMLVMAAMGFTAAVWKNRRYSPPC